MSDTIEREKTPDQHSDIVGGSTASRVLNCPASVRVLQRMQAALDAEADAIIEDARSDLARAADDLDSELQARGEDKLVKAEKVRASLNKSSTYADEGTALHEIMAYIVDNEIERDAVLNDPKIDEMWQRYELKDELMWTCVFPALEAFNKKLNALYEEAGPDAELLIRVESQVEFPGIEGAFGTCDVLIRSPKRTVVWDWKFGAGVPVWASYKASAEPGVIVDYGNDQLMFYARGAMNTYPDYFGCDYGDVEQPMPGDDIWPVDLVICQPRTIEDGAVSEFTVTVSDIENFALDLIDAVNEALTAENPTMKRDDKWCRFAACKTICPLHVRSTTGMAALGEKLGKLQFAAAGDAVAKQIVANRETAGLALEGPKQTEYREALAAMLDIAEIVEPYIKEARAQAHAFLEAGGTIPNWRLVPKRAAGRSWKEDRKKTDAMLARLGLGLEDRREPWEPISPAQAEKKLKAIGVNLTSEGSKPRATLDKYIAPGVSSGSTLAPADDPRPDVVGTSEKVAALADKIASLGSPT